MRFLGRGDGGGAPAVHSADAREDAIGAGEDRILLAQGRREALRALLAFPAINVVDRELLQRTVEVYDVDRLDFADAYLVASAERTGVGVVASFDRSIDRVGTVRREEPS